MRLDIFKQINWVDVFLAIVFIRILYLSLKKGFIVEIFKLMGAVSAIYVSMHYYTRVSDLFRGMLKIGDKMPLDFSDFIAFMLLALVGYAIFWGIRIAFCTMFKSEAVPILSKWGGLILGVARGILFASLLTFMLVISSVAYGKDSVNKSYSGPKIFKIAPATYFYLWNNLFSKFITGEKRNNTILEVQSDINS